MWDVGGLPLKAWGTREEDAVTLSGWGWVWKWGAVLHGGVICLMAQPTIARSESIALPSLAAVDVMVGVGAGEEEITLPYKPALAERLLRVADWVIEKLLLPGRDGSEIKGMAV